MFRDYMKIRKEEGYKTPKGRDTHPSTEVAEQRGHRAIDADIYPTDTPQDLTDLSASALVVLARDGAKSDHGDGRSVWHARGETADGLPFDISLIGPDLPAGVADQMILPSDIPNDPHWQETYHLSVAPPNVALELTWGTDEPLRILNFSRGDWEAQLQDMAG
jgi:hypothetical protein